MSTFVTLQLPTTLDTSTANLIEDFFVPLLARASRYDRGVGFFSSGWLRLAAKGMVDFAANGGRARWVTSPILSEADWAALEMGEAARDDPVLRAALSRNIEALERQLAEDTLSALAWMVADEILTFKLALPQNKLTGGEFHDKFGIFTDGEGHQVSFNGSYNESVQGTRNYESIKIFCSWEQPFAPLVQADIQRFERLWSNQDSNVRVFDLPEAAKAQILKLRKVERPYPEPESMKQPRIFEKPNHYQINRLWRHQDEAVEQFLKSERGVLDMATGTGKTRTALKIIKTIFKQNAIDTVIITTDGNDLLDQWYSELLSVRNEVGRPLLVYRHYGSHKEIQDFSLDPKNAILLASRMTVANALQELSEAEAQRTILIHDEVHRLGSPGNRNNLSGLSASIRFRLGLSATPEREYDEEGNEFIEQHIGPVLVTFELKDAIERGILTPFNYFPLEYEITEEDRQKIANVFSKKAARAREGNPMTDAELYIEIARVYKTSEAKLPIFEEFIENNQHLLERCIVFVETQKYGEAVLEIIHKHRPDFHTYFSGEDSATLQRFARGQLECLITCHRLSEGIDIQSLNTVILFSSAKARLETIQRIGRCLRINPADSNKMANIIDFIRVDPNSDELNTDEERSIWLTELSNIRPKE